jgi:pyridoxine 5-phosphate synthase
VPETREELTTQGGLDALFLHAHLRQIIRELHASEIRVSLFIDPQQEQVKMAAKLEAEAVEFNTGVYADVTPGADPLPELNRLREASRLASKLGLKVLAGHGLSLLNVGPVAAIPEIEELNIGHSIIGRALLIGLDGAVREMLGTINEGGQ